MHQIINWFPQVKFAYEPSGPSSQSLSQFSQRAGTHLSYSWVERGTVRVKCLAQGQNTMYIAWAQTQTAQDERVNHEDTAPPLGFLKRRNYYLKDSLVTSLIPYPNISCTFHSLLLCLEVFTCVCYFFCKILCSVAEIFSNIATVPTATLLLPKKKTYIQCFKRNMVKTEN